MNIIEEGKAWSYTGLLGMKDAAVDSARIKLMMLAAYHIAYTSLWNGEELSEMEKNKTKKAIKAYLVCAEQPERAYSEMVQRILMARMYVQENEGIYVPEPSEWLRSDNVKGFTGTAVWYERLTIKRKSYPLHRLELKAFAEAVLEMMEEPCSKNFHYWRSWFIEHDEQELLNLFLSVIANSSF